MQSVMLKLAAQPELWTQSTICLYNNHFGTLGIGLVALVLPGNKSQAFNLLEQFGSLD
jgi:hypothetical protein